MLKIKVINIIAKLCTKANILKSEKYSKYESVFI